MISFGALPLFYTLAIAEKCKYLRQSGLVGSDVNDRPVEFFNADVELVHDHFELLHLLYADYLQKFQNLLTR